MTLFSVGYHRLVLCGVIVTMATMATLAILHKQLGVIELQFLEVVGFSVLAGVAFVLAGSIVHKIALDREERNNPIHIV